MDKMCIQMSYIETHKNHIIDLLNGAELDIFTLRNVSLVKVKTEYEALALLFKGISQKCNNPTSQQNVCRRRSPKGPKLRLSSKHYQRCADVQNHIDFN